MPLTTFQTAAGVNPNSIANDGGYSSVGGVSTGAIPLATSPNTNTIEGNTNYSSAIYGMTELTPDATNGSDGGVITIAKTSKTAYWVIGGILLVAAVGVGIYFFIIKKK